MSFFSSPSPPVIDLFFRILLPPHSFSQRFQFSFFFLPPGEFFRRSRCKVPLPFFSILPRRLDLGFFFFFSIGSGFSKKNRPFCFIEGEEAISAFPPSSPGFNRNEPFFQEKDRWPFFFLLIGSDGSLVSFCLLEIDSRRTLVQKGIRKNYPFPLPVSASSCFFPPFISELNLLISPFRNR